MELSKPYWYLFDELYKGRYTTLNVYESFIRGDACQNTDKVNVILRIDVDDGLELCEPLASILKEKGINASFYFLTHPDRYYDIWSSSIPGVIRESGFEVGLHTDHYYGELVFGKNALKGIKNDVVRLSGIVGEQIKGMVFHGHNEIDSLGKRNCDIYKDIPPGELGLAYHDFTIGMGPYGGFQHCVISDYLGIQNGWRYWPPYPRQALQRLPLGSVVVLIIHPQNIFQSRAASSKNGVKNMSRHLYYWSRIRLRHQIVGAIIGEGKSARKEFKKLSRLPHALKNKS